jgi:cell shape-determining protein MreC
MRLNLNGNSEGKDQVILDVFLDRKTHESLVEYCRSNSFDSATGFVKAVERGMKFFRAAYYKEMKQDYVLLKEQAAEYERDNKALRQLVDENERFKQILNAHQIQKDGKRT